MSFVGLIFFIAGVWNAIVLFVNKKRVIYSIFIRILYYIIFILCIIIGVNLLLKGIFDPNTKSFWVHF